MFTIFPAMKHLIPAIILWAALAHPGRVSAQPQHTDIYLFDIDLVGGRLNYRNKFQATIRPGYDNQPHFSPDGHYMLYVSQEPDGQTEVYRHRLRDGFTERLTYTPESEYSPQAMPGRKAYSVVRVEADSTQRIWKFLYNKKVAPIPLFPETKGVGYYTWINSAEAAVYQLGAPPLLKKISSESRPNTILARNPGRSIHMIPTEEAISFVLKEDNPENRWPIVKIGFITGKQETIVQTLPGVEDFCWSPEGYMLMGKAGKLYKFTPGKDTDWQFAGDLGVGNFYRLTISPDGHKLAVVAFERR